MQKFIIKNGLIASGVLLGFNLIFLVVLGNDQDNYGIGEVVGYAAILLCLAFVYIGISQFNQTQNKIKFGKSMVIGTGISLFPSVLFGAYNVVYIKWIDPDFLENYYTTSINEMEKTLSAAEFEEAKMRLLEEQEMFQHIGFQFLMMFLTVFILGLIISLISTIIIQYKNKTT